MLQLAPADHEYWIRKETEVEAELVDLADYDFVIGRERAWLGISRETRCPARPAVAEALVQAREHLPPGHGFVVWDGYRSWPEQQKVSAYHRMDLMRATSRKNEHAYRHVRRQTYNRR